MSGDYQKTISYWDKVFEAVKEYDPHKNLREEQLESGLRWLAANGGRLLDFGCGTGRVALRALCLGANQIYGIDISPQAIELANRMVEHHQFDDSAQFVTGSVPNLASLDDASFDSAILFNVVDNITPDDGYRLLAEIHRIVKPGGRILVKINPYITRGARREFGFAKLAEEFYEERTGLYLWNLSDEKAEELFTQHFSVSEWEEVEFKDFDMTNRIYRLVKED